MANVNIRRDIDDPFYRYKMPKLASKIEGRGNGIKTVVVNMSDIGRSLNRPPSYPTKFFGCELGAQVNISDNDDRYIVNGAHDAARLQDLLDGFIKKFVLCGGCFNPETDLVILKDHSIIRDCKACGRHSNVDQNHRLVTYILKHPPPKEGTYEKEVAKKAEGLPTPETGSPNGAGSPADSGDEEELGKKMKNLALNGRKHDEEDVEEDDDDGNPFSAIAEYILENPTVSNKELKMAAGNLGLKDDKIAFVLAYTILTEDVVAQLKQKEVISRLKGFLKSEKCQRAFLGGIETLIGKYSDSLMTKTSQILKAVYDLDLLVEGAFVAWGEKPSKKFVDRKTSKEIKDSAKKFLEWLANAEEESSDSDEA